jgi:hypothetical protein
MAGTLAAYNYAIGTGASLPLGSLTNTQDLMGYPPKSQPVNTQPVRTVTLSGRVYGEGAITHEWPFPQGLAPDKVGTLMNFLFGAGGTQTSVQVTINQRDPIVGTYVRYTGWVERPIPGQDFTYDRTFCFDFKLKFLGMVQL